MSVHDGYVKDIMKFVPKISNLKLISSNNDSKIKVLLGKCVNFLWQVSVDMAGYKQNLNYLEVVYDLLYDNLHTGEWHAVANETREMFTLTCYLKVVYLLLSAENIEQHRTLRDCMYVADMGILLGAKISINEEDLLTETAKLLTIQLNNLEDDDTPPCKKFKMENMDPSESYDVPILVTPTIEYFSKHHYTQQTPALLRNIIDHWPALQKWRDPNYLIELAGNRIVPIEIGGQYNQDNWSQGLIKFKDFVREHLTESNDGTAYLAQHELFDQIPELKNDIQIPDYIGQTDLNPKIKAWLGPRGTVSPLHTDPTHNFLCQVFGKKEIILAAPDDTANLYPHEHFVLNNTSRIDARKLDFEKFPLARNVKFYRLLLQSGDVLYIPPKWWHYVESLSPSFSVSFWFE